MGQSGLGGRQRLFMDLGGTDLFEEIVGRQGIHMGFFAHRLNHALPKMDFLSFPVLVYTFGSFLSCSFHWSCYRKAKFIPPAVIANRGNSSLVLSLLKLNIRQNRKVPILSFFHIRANFIVVVSRLLKARGPSWQTGKRIWRGRMGEMSTL